MRSVIRDSSSRKDLIEEILNKAVHNPLLTDDMIARLYKELAIDILLYVDTGIDTIRARINSMLSDESHELNPWLSTIVSKDGEKVADVIFADLK